MSLSSLAHLLLLLLASHFVGRPPPTKSPQRNDEILRIILVNELTESICRSHSASKLVNCPKQISSAHFEFNSICQQNDAPPASESNQHPEQMICNADDNVLSLPKSAFGPFGFSIFLDPEAQRNGSLPERSAALSLGLGRRRRGQV